jgi:hypothetical protein
MKSISKFVVAAAALLFAASASAGTLYWQVDDKDLGESEQGWGAELWMLDTSSNTKTSLSDGLIDAPTGIQQADITNYTDDKYKFFVELVNYSTGTSTDGYKWSYHDLYKSGYVAMDARDIPTVMAAAGGHSNFAAAPEPTSGLLLLMGGAMLALRRRRQK